MDWDSLQLMQYGKLYNVVRSGVLDHKYLDLKTFVNQLAAENALQKADIGRFIADMNANIQGGQQNVQVPDAAQVRAEKLSKPSLDSGL